MDLSEGFNWDFKSKRWHKVSGKGGKMRKSIWFRWLSFVCELRHIQSRESIGLGPEKTIQLSIWLTSKHPLANVFCQKGLARALFSYFWFLFFFFWTSQQCCFSAIFQGLDVKIWLQNYHELRNISGLSGFFPLPSTRSE